MTELLRSTTAYRYMKACKGENAVLVVFPDEAYLRPLLRECAKAFFQAADGSRTAELIQKESFADCLFYPAAGEKLTVEDGAKIAEESAMRSVEGGRRLFVIDGFHTASALLQNKLLKILEEPPQGVCFLLGATAEYSVLPTVLSRMRKISVTPFAEEEIGAALLRNYGAERAQAAAEAAAASGGIYSAAEELLSGGGEEFRAAKELLSGDAAKLCRELEGNVQKRVFFSAVKLLLRDMLFYRTGQGAYAVLKDDDVVGLSREYPEGAIVSALALAEEAERQITFNAGFSACAEALAVGITEEREKWKRLS